MLFDDVWVMPADRVPDDRQRHREELEGDGPLDGFLGAVARIADAEQFFAVFEGDFDRPAVCVALDDLGGTGVKVGGDQRELVAGGLALVFDEDHARGGVGAAAPTGSR